MADRKAGSITARGEGKWLIRWFAGLDPKTGKRIYPSKVVAGTYAAAVRALGKESHEVSEGNYVAPVKQTLGQYLEAWLRDVLATKVSASTLVSYTARMKLDVIDRIGGLKLDKVTPQVIQALYTDLSKDGQSPRTVQYTHTILKQALKTAISWKLLRSNPLTDVVLPKKTHTEMQVWTAEEVNQFLQATEGTRDYALWYTLLHTGMRPGEAFGLKWEDLDGDRLAIRRAVASGSKFGEFVIKAPKTKKGVRQIALSQDHLAVLARHRRSQMEEMLAAGAAYTRSDYVFADRKGEHETSIPARGRWHTAARRAKLPEIRMYDARHTHATLLLKAGVNPKVVSERLGHASVVITLDTYSHVLPDMQDEAVDRLAVILKAARK
jgi:integrase